MFLRPGVLLLIALILSLPAAPSYGQQQYTIEPIAGLDFYTGEKFPGWKHDLFSGALKQQEVRRLRLEDRKLVEQEVILKNVGRVRDVATGPDGFLYVILNKPDSIIRLVPAG